VVDGILKGKLFTFTDADVEATMCQFLPFGTVVSDNRRVIVVNRGPVAHDIEGYAIDNPYDAVTDINGSFALTELPAGRYRIKAWHPNLGYAGAEDYCEAKRDDVA